MTLVRIVAPHFVAGIVLHRSRCIQAAPIVRWAVGKPWYQIKQYLERRRWAHETLEGCPVCGGECTKR